MKPIMIAFGLCACSSVLHAQNYTQTPSRASATASFIQVDEQVLLRGLERLAADLRAPTAHSVPKKEDMSEILRYQLLLNLLMPREQPTIVYQIPPQHSPASVDVTVKSQTVEHGLPAAHAAQEERLARLEGMLQRLLTNNMTIGTASTLAPKSVLLQPTSKVRGKQTIQPTDTEVVVIDSTSLKQREAIKALEARLAALQEQLQITMVEESNSSDHLDTVHAVEPKAIELPSLSQGLKSIEHNAQTVIRTTDTVQTKVTERVTEYVRVATDFKRSVYFTVASHQIDDAAAHTLTEVNKFLEDYPNAKLTLSGFASPEGNEGRNKELAQRRIRSVIDYLTAKGIDSSRLLIGSTLIDMSRSAPQLARRVDLTLVD